MTAAAFPRVAQLAERLRTRTWRDMAKRAWLILLGMLLLKWLLPAGQAFTYLERGAYRTGIAIALMAALFELPLDAALLPLLPPTLVDPHKVHVLHALLAIGVLSTLVWVLGDRWHIGRGCHVLTADGLELRVGVRTGGTIPLAAIADCRRIDVDAHIWCRREGIERHRTLTASPLDKPNTALMLTPDSHVRLTHLGVERTGLACVFLYVDQPDRLVRAVCSERQQ